MFKKMQPWAISVVALLISACGIGPSQMAAPKIIGEMARDSSDALPKDHQHNSPDADKNQPMDEQQLRDSIISFGIRDFGQIHETMAVLTGIDPMTRVNVGGNATQTIQALFMELSTQLPESNDAKAFLAAHQVGISKLSTEYCDALISDTARRSQLAPNFNFTQAPAAAFNMDSKLNLVTGLIDQFWGVDLKSLPDRDESIEEMLTLADALIGRSGNNAQATQSIAKGLCTAVLASAPVIFL